MFNIIDLASGWKADLIIRKDRPFSREELARRQPVNISGVETYIATPEDAILSKIEWHSMSGSERQRRDVLEMLVVNFDSLDRERGSGCGSRRLAAEVGVPIVRPLLGRHD